MTCGDLFLGCIAILFPPIAVWIKSGLCSGDSLINILLCMLGYFPGLLHAWYIIARHPEHNYDYEVVPDAERGNGNQNGGRVTYYYVRREPGSGRRGYGTQGQGHNRPAPPPPAGQGSSRPAPLPPASGSQQPPEGPSAGAGGDEAGAPPSYSDVVKGDNKIQTQN